MRSLIGFTYEGRLDELVIRMELFSEVYAAFVYEEQENHRLPSYASIREILYWFVSDYADVAAEAARMREEQKNLQLSMRFPGLKSMTTMRFSRLSQKKPVQRWTRHGLPVRQLLRQ
jgi:hypothetical protein